VNRDRILKWDSSRPKVPGWYYYMTSDPAVYEQKILCVRVVRDRDGMLVVDRAGLPVSTFGGKWAGPLQDPPD
jgi:hypothetical protein